MDKPRIKYHPAIKEYACAGSGKVGFGPNAELAYCGWMVETSMTRSADVSARLAMNSALQHHGQLLNAWPGHYYEVSANYFNAMQNGKWGGF